MIIFLLRTVLRIAQIRLKIGLCNLYSSFAVLEDFPGSLAAQLADSPLKASDSGLSGVQPDDIL